MKKIDITFDTREGKLIKQSLEQLKQQDVRMKLDLEINKIVMDFLEKKLTEQQKKE